MPPAKNSRGQDPLWEPKLESFPWSPLMRGNAIFSHILLLKNPKLSETPAWGSGKQADAETSRQGFEFYLPSHELCGLRQLT